MSKCPRSPEPGRVFSGLACGHHAGDVHLYFSIMVSRWHWAALEGKSIHRRFRARRSTRKCKRTSDIPTHASGRSDIAIELPQLCAHGSPCAKSSIFDNRQPSEVSFPPPKSEFSLPQPSILPQSNHCTPFSSIHLRYIHTHHRPFLPLTIPYLLSFASTDTRFLQTISTSSYTMSARMFAPKVASMMAQTSTKVARPAVRSSIKATSSQRAFSGTSRHSQHHPRGQLELQWLN